MKGRLLLILHIPPPVHGAAVVGKILIDSIAINKCFHIDYINLSTSHNIKEIGKGGIKKVYNLFSIQSKVLKAIFTKKYDLCYMTLTASGPGFYKDLMIIFILKLFRKKILYHFHNKGVLGNSKKWFNDVLYRFAFYNTKSILLSPRLYDDLSKYITRSDVYYCANGIPDIENAFTQMKTYSVTTSRCRLLFLSNMMKEKGIKTLIEACRLLKERGYDFECHFVGAWSTFSELEFSGLIEKYDLADNLFAHGAKFGNEKGHYFLNADIFVLPTYYHNECFPLVLLEAMSYGLPVISTTEGGIPDIVIDNETGYIVPRKNFHLLADKLEILIKDSALRKKFGEEGRTRFLNHFTISKFENNMITIFDDLVSQST